MISVDKLVDLGLLYRVFAGIQIDVNVVRQGKGETSLCDHNCTIVGGGGYDCPAAFTLNKGGRKPFAAWETLLAWITMTAEGLRKVRDDFLTDSPGYFDKFLIPHYLREDILETLRRGKIEVNLFGGNPEMHDGIMDLLAGLAACDFAVSLTTTGRRFLRDPSFTARVRKTPPRVLALSADDFEVATLKELRDASLEDIKSRWRKVPATHGQAQKFLEGIYAAKLFAGKEMPLVLFNLVIHRGNLTRVEEMVELLGESFPGALVNPYPMQSAFSHEHDCFTPTELGVFEKLIDRSIALSKDPQSPIVKRLHYWLALKAVFERFRAGPERIGNMLAGYDAWRCYRNPTLPYLQIGKGPVGLIEDRKEPGGKLGCFWNNRTITRWNRTEKAREIVEYVHGGMKNLSRVSVHPCPGCIMPRLMFNMITTECGLAPDLVPKYLRLRREHVGF